MPGLIGLVALATVHGERQIVLFGHPRPRAATKTAGGSLATPASQQGR
jgi:hypothetical protein